MLNSLVIELSQQINRLLINLTLHKKLFSCTIRQCQHYGHFIKQKIQPILSSRATLYLMSVRLYIDRGLFLCRFLSCMSKSIYSRPFLVRRSVAKATRDINVLFDRRFRDFCVFYFFF